MGVAYRGAVIRMRVCASNGFCVIYPIDIRILESQQQHWEYCAHSSTLIDVYLAFVEGVSSVKLERGVFIVGSNGEGYFIFWAISWLAFNKYRSWWVFFSVFLLRKIVFHLKKKIFLVVLQAAFIIKNFFSKWIFMSVTLYTFRTEKPEERKQWYQIQNRRRCVAWEQTRLRF